MTAPNWAKETPWEKGSMVTFRKIPAVQPAVEDWLVVVVNPFARDPSDRFLVVAHAQDIVSAQQQAERLMADNPARALIGNPIMYLAQIRMTVEVSPQVPVGPGQES